MDFRVKNLQEYRALSNSPRRTASDGDESPAGRGHGRLVDRENSPRVHESVFFAPPPGNDHGSPSRRIAVCACHVWGERHGSLQAKKPRISIAAKANIDRATERTNYTRTRSKDCKADEKAIEKEAREQLHYARPGELVYVPQTPANAPPPLSHSAKK